MHEGAHRIESSFPVAHKAKYSVHSPPGTIERRVFIGGNYALMPILREIEEAISGVGFQPVIAFDFDIPKEKTREYTLRLMSQCEYLIFEMTLSNGNLVEYVRAQGFSESNILQVYMAMDENKDPPKTMSVMSWQVTPPPQGYTTIAELREIVSAFLTAH
jgi:hypothetical protein